MTWTETIKIEELNLGDKKVVKIGDQKILLINHENKIYAVSNVCPHLKLPLSKGKVNANCAIVCPFHRSSFDLKTGEVQDWTPFPPVLGNLLGKISKENSLPVFATSIENNKIMVDL